MINYPHHYLLPFLGKKKVLLEGFGQQSASGAVEEESGKEIGLFQIESQNEGEKLKKTNYLDVIVLCRAFLKITKLEV